MFTVTPLNGYSFVRRNEMKWKAFCYYLFVVKKSHVLTHGTHGDTRDTEGFSDTIKFKLGNAEMLKVSDILGSNLLITNVFRHFRVKPWGFNALDNFTAKPRDFLRLRILYDQTLNFIGFRIPRRAKSWYFHFRAKPWVSECFGQF